MADAVALMKAIKKAAIQAIRAEKLTEIRFGKVVGVSPLLISVDQKMTLGKAQLVLSRNVTDYETEITVDAETEKKKITVHNGLVVGDEVILFRQQGGQKYVVKDRIG